MALRMDSSAISRVSDTSSSAIHSFYERKSNKETLKIRIRKNALVLRDRRFSRNGYHLCGGLNQWFCILLEYFCHGDLLRNRFGHVKKESQEGKAHAYDRHHHIGWAQGTSKVSDGNEQYVQQKA